jgi:HEPN domain-containing protein
VSAALAAAFLRAAEEDLAAARLLSSRLPRPAGYHLQQAAEKLVKALLAEAGVVPVPRTHDIGYLAALLPEHHPMEAALARLSVFTELHVTTRYPLCEHLAPPPAPEELERGLETVELLLEQAAVLLHQ